MLPPATRIARPKRPMPPATAWVRRLVTPDERAESRMKASAVYSATATK